MQGFITAVGRGKGPGLTIGQLRGKVRMEQGWLSQRIPIGCTPHGVAYLPAPRLFALLVSARARPCSLLTLPASKTLLLCFEAGESRTPAVCGVPGFQPSKIKIYTQ